MLHLLIQASNDLTPMTNQASTICNIAPVAYIKSCFTQRFGIPRQAGLVRSATAQIAFTNTENNRLSLRGLEEFSHLWVVFLFHQQKYDKSKPLVWPPRLGGKKTMGVFATRSPNRPNPIGISAVEIDQITHDSTEILIHIKGGDFLDGTPVLDLKPYVAFADSIPLATSSWVPGTDALMPVEWNHTAADNLAALQTTDSSLADAQQIIDETLAQDPRPAHERNKDGKDGQLWHMRLLSIDISWTVKNSTALVTAIKRCT